MLCMAAMLLITMIITTLCGACKPAHAKSLNFREKSPIILTRRRAIKLKPDGTVVAVGANEYDQCDTSNWENIASIAADDFVTIGLKSDGTVVAAGALDAEESGLSEWKDIVDIATTGEIVIGLKSDGQILIAGDYRFLPIDEVLAWKDIIGVYGQGNKIAGLRSDGTVVIAYTSVEGRVDELDWTDIVDVAVAEGHVVGLKSNGTVVAYSPVFSDNAACDTENWTDIVAISAKTGGTIGLKSDGTIVACGAVGTWDEKDIPDTHSLFQLNNVAAVSASTSKVLVLFQNDRVGLYGAWAWAPFTEEEFEKLQG